MTAEDRNPDSTTGAPADAHEPVQHYEIRVKGHLPPRWSTWFEGMTIEPDGTEGTTVISGPVVDQAALHGLLQRLRDVAIPLVSLVPVSPKPETAGASQKQG